MVRRIHTKKSLATYSSYHPANLVLGKLPLPCFTHHTCCSITRPFTIHPFVYIVHSCSTRRDSSPIAPPPHSPPLKLIQLDTTCFRRALPCMLSPHPPAPTVSSSSKIQPYITPHTTPTLFFPHALWCGASLITVVVQIGKKSLCLCPLLALGNSNVLRAT
jgi:hypothetical protein